MKKFIREKLREDLKYYHVKGDVRNDEYELGEDIVVPTLSLPSEVDLTNEDKEQIKVLCSENQKLYLLPFRPL